jgi:hypothetical protein
VFCYIRYQNTLCVATILYPISVTRYKLSSLQLCTTRINSDRRFRTAAHIHLLRYSYMAAHVSQLKVCPRNGFHFSRMWMDGWAAWWRYQLMVGQTASCVCGRTGGQADGETYVGGWRDRWVGGCVDDQQDKEERIEGTSHLLFIQCIAGTTVSIPAVVVAVEEKEAAVVVEVVVVAVAHRSNTQRVILQY